MPVKATRIKRCSSTAELAATNATCGLGIRTTTAVAVAKAGWRPIGAMLVDRQRRARFQCPQQVIGAYDCGELVRQVAQRGGVDFGCWPHFPV